MARERVFSLSRSYQALIYSPHNTSSIQTIHNPNKYKTNIIITLQTAVWKRNRYFSIFGKQEQRLDSRGL